MRTVLVPVGRIERWCANFATRHGRADLSVGDGRVLVSGDDGAHASIALPLSREYGGPTDLAALVAAAAAPGRWGVLLVRKGGFAVAVLDGERVVASKVGQRHVQGRTKAGGQSQQRFARRRDNQARQAYEAAAEHAHRVLVTEAGGALEALVCGGDRPAVDAVLTDPRLTRLAAVRVGAWLAVPDPRRAVLDQAVADALSLVVEVHEPEGSSPAGAGR